MFPNIGSKVGRKRVSSVTNLFQASSTGVQALIAQGAVGQTAKIQEWRNSAGTVVASVDNSGNIVTGTINSAAITASGLLSFTGTTIAGVQLNSLTTTQQNALTGVNGQIIWNSTQTTPNYYDGAWQQIAKLGINTWTGLQYWTNTDNITAHAGGGQGSATAITTKINRVATVASAADSIKLPVSVAGLHVIIVNGATTNAMQVFGAGTDTINDVATATGVSHAAGTMTIYSCPVAGKWYATALTAGGGGTPGGSSGQVQYNLSGAFAGAMSIASIYAEQHHVYGAL